MKRAIELITDDFKVISTEMLVFALQMYCDDIEPSWVISRPDILDQPSPEEVIFFISGYIHAAGKIRGIEAYCNFYCEKEEDGFEAYMLTLYIGLERIVLYIRYNEKETTYEVVKIESDIRREMMRNK